jgi:hypothetical protein
MMAELLDPSTQGNSNGVCLLEEFRQINRRLERAERRQKQNGRRIEQLKRRIEQLKRRIEQLKRRIEQNGRRIESLSITITAIEMSVITAIRMSVLDEWSGYKSEEAEALREEQNDMAHGGNVMEDYRLIGDMMTVVRSDRADARKLAFEAMYGAQYLTCVDRQLELAPKKIHNVMNIVANVKSLYTWTKTKDADKKRDRGYILDKGRSIIQQWTEWMVPMQSLFLEGSDTLALYNQVRELYFKY